MKPHARILIAALLGLALQLHAGVCQALLSDQKSGKWRLIGKFRTEATFRLTGTPDNNPIPLEAGDLVTQRNLLFIEWSHDIGNVTSWLALSYFLQGRFFYDSAWDVGPDVLKNEEVRRYFVLNNQKQIDELKSSADLFMAYLDVITGPLFLRVGRQVISWGEMSTLRVIDVINPLDNSSLAVDLLERRLPLFMVRTNLAFEEVGPFSSLALEGYYIPGCLENRNGETIIDGSPMLPPIGRYTLQDLEDPFSLASLMQITEQVEDDYNADRYGVRLGMMIKGLDLNFIYSRMYSDRPVAFIDIDGFQPIHMTWSDILSINPADPFGSILGGQKLDVILKVDKVDVFGGFFNYYWGLIDTVIRGEIGYFKNVPKMTAGSVRDMIGGMGGQIYLPGGELTLGQILSNISLGDIENEILPFSSGNLTTFDVLRYGVGLDKFMKITFLSREDFIFILEYVGSKTLGYEENTILIPWEGPNGETLYEPEYSNTIVFIGSTNYLNGNLEPRLVMMYEFESQAFVINPRLNYQWRTLEFGIYYFHTFSSTYHGNLGMLESRNELSVSFTWNF